MKKNKETNREIINEYLEEQAEEYEEKAVKIAYDGKQFIIRIPKIISTIGQIKKGEQVIFKVNYNTKKITMQIIEGKLK